MPAPLPDRRRTVAPGGLWRGTVTQVSPLMVTVPRLTGSEPVGPCETAPVGTVQVGDPVWVGMIEGRAGDLVVIARRG